MVKQKLDIGFFSGMYSQINGTAIACRNLAEALAQNTDHNIHVYAPGIQKPRTIPKNLILHNFYGAPISPKTGFVLSFPLHKYFFCQAQNIKKARNSYFLCNFRSSFFLFAKEFGCNFFKAFSVNKRKDAGIKTNFDVISV